MYKIYKLYTSKKYCAETTDDGKKNNVRTLNKINNFRLILSFVSSKIIYENKILK